jgi:hypothetical protein
MTIEKNSLATETQDFVKRVKHKYNLDVNVILGGTILDQKSGNKIALEILRDETYHAMCDYDYALQKYLSIRNKSRKREFVSWQQVFAYIAWMHGHSKLDIGRSLLKNHATIISSIKKTQDALDGYNPYLLERYRYLTNYYLTHVGDITENTTRQDNA